MLVGLLVFLGTLVGLGFMSKPTNIVSLRGLYMFSSSRAAVASGSH